MRRGVHRKNRGAVGCLASLRLAIGRGPRARRSIAPLARFGVFLAVAALSGLHLQLLWTRLADGSVLEPLVVIRWLVSVALVLLFAGLRRRGLSLVRGREALILWLLVVLIHGIGWVPAGEAAAPHLMPAEVFLIAAPLGFAVVSVFWAGAVALAEGAKSAAARRWRRRLERDAGALRDPLLLAACGPRAPPA